jgi:hypothetical protein
MVILKNGQPASRRFLGEITLNEIIGDYDRSSLFFCFNFFLLDPTVGLRRPTFGGASDVCRDGDLGMPITDKMGPS